MNEIIASPLFSIFLCIIAYKIGLLIQQKTKLGSRQPIADCNSDCNCFSECCRHIS